MNARFELNLAVLPETTFPVQVLTDAHGGHGLFATGPIPMDTFLLIETPIVSAMHPRVERVCRWCCTLNPETNLRCCVRCLASCPGVYDIISAEDELYDKTKNGFLYNILLTRLLKIEEFSSAADEDKPVALDEKEVSEVLKKTPTKLHSLTPINSEWKDAAKSLRLQPVDAKILPENLQVLSHAESIGSNEGLKRLKINEEAASRDKIETLVRVCCNNAFKLDLSFHQVDHDAFRESTSCKDPSVKKAEFLFSLGSFLNHSCQPNARFRIIEGRLYVRAARDIAAGEEILIDYFSDDGDFGDACESYRILKTLTQYGFTCDCPKCSLCRKCNKAKEKTCSNCGVVRYCATCGRKDRAWWKQHGVFCTEFRSLMKKSDVENRQ